MWCGRGVLGERIDTGVGGQGGLLVYGGGGGGGGGGQGFMDRYG